MIEILMPGLAPGIFVFPPPRKRGRGTGLRSRTVEGASESTNMRAPKNVVGNAQHLRRKLSVPEARLWNRLRARLPGQPVFRRQHPIGPYILDFYCPKAKLGVEIDGIAHDMGDRPQRDIERDAWLAKHGVTVVRIPAHDLRPGIDEMADAIVRMAAEKP
jgi:very-short-patch-repair endonuclease